MKGLIGREVYRPDTRPVCQDCGHVHYAVVSAGACPDCNCTRRAAR